MQIMRTNKLITRHNWVPDTFYQNPDGSVFVTPDGVGAFFYDDMDEAVREMGELSRHWILYREADLDTNPEWVADHPEDYR